MFGSLLTLNSSFSFCSLVPFLFSESSQGDDSILSLEKPLPHRRSPCSTEVNHFLERLTTTGLDRVSWLSGLPPFWTAWYIRRPRRNIPVGWPTTFLNDFLRPTGIDQSFSLDDPSSLYTISYVPFRPTTPLVMVRRKYYSFWSSHLGPLLHRKKKIPERHKEVLRDNCSDYSSSTVSFGQMSQVEVIIYRTVSSHVNLDSSLFNYLPC